MNKSYSTYIENLKGRRYDEVIRESILSDSFHSTDYSEPVKYVLESMQEIDPSYSYKFFSAFRRTQDLITQQLKKLDILVDVRYLGPHNSETHIELYGGLELLVILKSYDRKPSLCIEELVQCIIQILDKANAYDVVDYSDKHRIYIQTRKPTASVTIIPAVWINSSLYQNTHLEINRGICEYNFIKKTRRIYLPFLNSARLNSRNRKSGGSLKHLIRFLSSVVRDAELSIDLVHEEIVGVLYNMRLKELAVPSDSYLSLLPNVSQQLQYLINNDEYREKLLSPSRTEYVFGKRPKSEALMQLKTELDEIIADLTEVLKGENKTLMGSFKY